MLFQLNITDFAIIKHLDLSLREGLNTVSGETGAGKSIIINAINLILGGRSSADLIRTGCDEAVVEGLFVFPDNPGLDEMLGAEGIPFDCELLIKRVISREGRNKVFINGSLATLQILVRLGPRLISISGQYEHQLLLKPDNHLYLLDDFSGLEDERVDLGRLFDRYQSLKEDLRAIEKEIVEQRERGELARFQIQEIETANPVPGEDELLSDEKSRLQHAEELLEIVSGGYHTLYEKDDSVLASVARCTKAMDKGAGIHRELGPIRDSLAEIAVDIEDVSFALRDFKKAIQIDPQRLEQVLERLEVLRRLKRKYGATLEDVLQFKDDLASKMFDLEKKQAKWSELTRELQEVEAELMQKAGILSQKRRKGADAFKAAMKKELQQLHMKETEFEVRFEDQPDAEGEGTEGGIENMRPDGLDRVEFMISPNPGRS